ncbi:Glycerol-3-phosphate dehydrogenase [NAD(P)+] [hydrothermal vent metagenome]|uniref:Glycerol-3-phosphate dehydrogenase [NAD(P)+] n=1 Tax=hydrothermal vent metagenome TaxID=652676 RepID=A0A3B1C3T8_9ZZZZ
MTKKGPVAVIGAGAWGTAIAWSLAENGVDTRLWALEPEVVESVNRDRENSVFLPGVKLPDNLLATDDLGEATKNVKLVVFVVPSQFMRGMLERLAKVMPEDAILLSAVKGIETETLALPADMIRDIMPKSVAEKSCYLSGPTFAKELAHRVPTAAAIASKNLEAVKLAQSVLSAPYFRLYTHADVVGVELGGAVKNVMAVAAGISDGLGFGHNTRAALITRGLHEMTKLGVSMGADERTFAGLAGMGDLLLTCTGDLSRNRNVGMRLGRGEKIDEIKKSMTAVAEGVATALSVYHLAKKQKVDMPIANEVYRVIYEGKDPKAVVEGLMSRSLKPEF